MAGIVEIFGVLRKKQAVRSKTTGGLAGARMTIVFTVPDIRVDTRESKIAQTVARAVEKQIKANMLNGLSPSGFPMPPVAAATVRRRRYRYAQGQRGGLTDHFRKKSENNRALKNFSRRFDAKLLGRFLPGVGVRQGLFGLESGMLAKSVRAVPEGTTWRVYFAGPRGNLDRSGTSAVNRVFRNVQPWSQAAMQQGIIQDGLKQAVQERLIVNGRLILTQAKRVVSTFTDIFEIIRAGVEHGEAP